MAKKAKKAKTITKKTARPVKTEGGGECRIDVLHRYTDATPYDAASLYELVAHVHRHVNRHRKGDAHVTARAAEDHGIDADDFSAQVEERTAGVAGIHGDVGLDERYVGFTSADGA